MSATPIITSTRYFQPGVSKVLLVTAIANIATGATRAEINAGTDVSAEVAAINGWKVESESKPTPDMGGRFVKQTNGRITVSSSGITFWADVAGNDIRDVLVLDQATHVVFLDGGDVAGRNMDIFKVKVAALGKIRDLEEVPRIDGAFTISDFAENLAVPA